MRTLSPFQVLGAADFFEQRRDAAKCGMIVGGGVPIKREPGLKVCFNPRSSSNIRGQLNRVLEFGLGGA